MNDQLIGTPPITFRQNAWVHLAHLNLELAWLPPGDPALKGTRGSAGPFARPALFDRSDAIAVLEEILPSLPLVHYRNLWGSGARAFEHRDHL